MKQKLSVWYLVLSVLLLTSISVCAKPPKKTYINVQVTPTHQDWKYKLGERADFDVRIEKSGHLLKDVKMSYEIGLERMDSELSGDMVLKNGSITLKGIKLRDPGFLRCVVSVVYEGKRYTSWGTAGFEPEKIIPVAEIPDDFDEFWDNAKAELAKIPMDPIVTLMPDLCTSSINVYHVSLQNIRMHGSWRGNSRFYGMLSVPKKPGKYPAILAVPGAGVRSYGIDNRADRNVIVFQVGIHGIPVNMPYENYFSLATGALSEYHMIRIDDRDNYYFKRVYMGIVRSIDFIYSLPEFDAENLAVTGGSQGGGLSIVTAGLDKRIKYMAAFYPALCDFPGYLEGRAGGWPHMYQHFDSDIHSNWLQTTPYYDAVNFARRITIPSWFSWGYNDDVCPPTSMYAAYNTVKSPKELHLVLEAEHWSYSEIYQKADAWMFENLFSE